MDIFIRKTFIRVHFKRINGEVEDVEEIPEEEEENCSEVQDNFNKCTQLYVFN